MTVFDRYEAQRKLLKAGKGICLPLADAARKLYLTPLKKYTNGSPTQILVSILASKDCARCAAFVWDFKRPPIGPLPIATLAYVPLRDAIAVHTLLLAIFFPIKNWTCPFLLLEYPKTKRGTFHKSKNDIKPKAKAKAKKQPNKKPKSNDSHTTTTTATPEPSTEAKRSRHNQTRSKAITIDG